MILRPYSQMDDEGMREGSGCCSLFWRSPVSVFRPTPQTDDGGMTEGRAGAVDLGDGADVMILQPYATNG
ncbi:hypothetical protein TNCV_1405651 [Trichonephila clavipes]|nr:hypothetical protein TNCV_1405651 [Trichonephila clavipes]